ncbi:hypothetical protein A2526_04075 [candidate division WOR-1 bacterium RIFOXYD2_FULL_36_8]|uniref:Uncharacterized protein n=1 Tax=candidate division WOR-1 bacterium RIFOXYB2_FULL_36_35 TaxID=1802578 RepID=A0A1F4S676_UNCSA|nr:MAG: hypothetical protein A2230_01285 [candidate division WOR-1 bacterium RIFOXYA2_FULL_36_21]OGC14392.1 MAG: hypothetical protein A2282_08070 [candidate division WOR-1 bacterium RIFOXYA12_FULL_36_13]OGC15932.1 MAG: hypothetical protein A2290_06755 [candidate division WOR-1 bacterium RIFOXYB2_FULL_36_35]OGC39745.1 MAG: hypothetical protein A2526_04075 [candidate division WOR-1 bacterium RIFOXYD2_FULL_36_8]
MTEILLEIRVVLNADHNELKGNRLYVAASELNNQINEIMLDLLAEEYNVKKNKIKIMKGQNSIQKTIKII